MDRARGAPPVVARAAVFGLFAALASSAGQTYFIGLFGSFLRQDHALTPSELGALYGASTLVSGALMFWLGASVDRISLKRIVPVALAILAAGSFVMSAAHGALSLAIAAGAVQAGGRQTRIRRCIPLIYLKLRLEGIDNPRQRVKHLSGKHRFYFVID